ncbi:hypothetical protein ACEQPO_14465 [Bacillus sp. SL00103]
MDIVLELEEMGFEIEASHHEVAPGQHEIDFLNMQALSALVMTFKRSNSLLKQLREKHGVTSCDIHAKTIVRCKRIWYAL